MASLLPVSSRPLARNVRQTNQAYRCGVHAVASERALSWCTSPSAMTALVTQKLKRFAASHVTRSIPVSGPGVSSSAEAPGSAAGQVTSELMNSMKAKICEALETDACTVTDVYGDGRHVSIEVVSKLFQDKSSMQRQRMVYKAIWMELQEAVHAVDSMSTKTPEELAA